MIRILGISHAKIAKNAKEDLLFASYADSLPFASLRLCVIKNDEIYFYLLIKKTKGDKLPMYEQNRA